MKKRAVPTVSDPSMQKVIADIYDALNRLIEIAPDGSTETDKDAPEGKVRIVFDGKYARLEVRGRDNWFTTENGTFILKEKN